MAGIEDADTLAQLPAGTSECGQALALGLSDKNHGSAAGSVARTSTDAAQGAQRHDSPLGPGISGDTHDDIPAGKRRVVSREPPAPSPGSHSPGDRRFRSSQPISRSKLRRLNARGTT